MKGILMIFCFLCFFRGFGQSKTTSNVKTIQYENFQLDPPDLPYQESFDIVGSRQVCFEKVDHGQLTISGPDLEGNNKITNYQWCCGADSETDFRFQVRDRFLYFNKEYALEFKFYHKLENQNTFKDKFKQKIVAILGQAYERNGFLINDREEFNKLISSVFESFGTISLADGEIKLIPLTDLFLKVIDIDNLYLLVQDKRRLKSNPDEIDGIRSEIKKIKPLTLTAYVTGGKFTQIEADAINAFIQNPIGALENTIKVKIEALPQPPNPDETFKNLKVIPSSIDQIQHLLDESQRRTTEITNYSKTFDDSVDDLDFGKIFSGSGPAFFITANTESIKNENIVGTRFTAVAGAGVAMLNAHLFGDHGPIEYQPLTYLAVKYYLGNVDKRVDNPYLDQTGSRPSLKNKLSILAGWKIGGDLSFQGRSLQTVVGINPIVGVSYDLNRYISLDLFGIFFKQSHINPLDTNTTLSLSPCLALSADFDLINRLKHLFDQTPYSTKSSTSK